MDRIIEPRDPHNHNDHDHDFNFDDNNYDHHSNDLTKTISFARLLPRLESLYAPCAASALLAEFKPGFVHGPASALTQMVRSFVRTPFRLAPFNFAPWRLA